MKTLTLLAAAVVALATTTHATAALSVTNGDFENGAGAVQQNVPDWFDHQTAFRAWVNPAAFNENGSENLGFGAGGGGFAYQSLGDYFAADGQTLYWSFEQVRFGNTFDVAALRLDIRFYAGDFAAAADDVDIEGHGSEPTELFAATYNSLNEDSLTYRKNSGALDLSGQADGTEIWLRIGYVSGDGVNSGGAPVDNVFASQTIPSPAALPAGLALMTLAVARRRRRR